MLTVTSGLSFFFYDTATPVIYTLSLHDALPISASATRRTTQRMRGSPASDRSGLRGRRRSEEHTSELQSHSDLVCRLLLEKKKDAQAQSHGSGSDMSWTVRCGGLGTETGGTRLL